MGSWWALGTDGGLSHAGHPRPPGVAPTPVCAWGSERWGLSPPTWCPSWSPCHPHRRHPGAGRRPERQGGSPAPRVGKQGAGVSRESLPSQGSWPGLVWSVGGKDRPAQRARARPALPTTPSLVDPTCRLRPAGPSLPPSCPPPAHGPGAHRLPTCPSPRPRPPPSPAAGPS